MRNRASRPLSWPESVHDLGREVRSPRGRSSTETVAWSETSRTRVGCGTEGQASLELRAIVGEGIGMLTADQRQVFEALIIDGVPIDVLAERMQTTRGDVYQRLHTARRVLRERLMRAEPV